MIEKKAPSEKVQFNDHMPSRLIKTPPPPPPKKSGGDGKK